MVKTARLASPMVTSHPVSLPSFWISNIVSVSGTVTNINQLWWINSKCLLLNFLFLIFYNIVCVLVLRSYSSHDDSSGIKNPPPELVFVFCRRGQPVAEFIFAATEETIFVHVIISAKLVSYILVFWFICICQ